MEYKHILSLFNVLSEIRDELHEIKQILSDTNKQIQQQSINKPKEEGNNNEHIEYTKWSDDQ